MNTATPENPNSDEENAQPVCNSRWGRTIVVSAVFVAGCIAIVATAAVLLLSGRPVNAPDWLRDRIEVRINNQLSGASLGFDDLELIVERGWRPSVRLRDVTFTDAVGVPIVSVANIDASLAMRPLLQGQVQPKRISVTGVVAELRRDQQGQVALSLGDNKAPTRQASDMAELVGQLDNVFDRPALRALVGLDLRALTLRYEDVRIEKAWTVDGGRLRIDRTGEDLRLSGDFALLSGGADVATLEMNYDSRLGSAAAELGVRITDVDAADIAAQGPALAWLDVLRAPISGALRVRVLPDGSVGPLNATLQIGAGVVQPTDQTQPIPFTAARSYFTYTPDTQTIQFDELSLESDWVTGSAEGRATLGEIVGGKLKDLTAQINISELVINPAQLYDDPISLGGAAMDLRLRLNPFELTLGQAQIADNGQYLRLSGDLKAAPDGWQLALDGHLDGIERDRLLTLWPKRLVVKTRKWLDENLLAANLKNVSLALRAEPDKKPDLHLGFEFSDAKIRYTKTMPIAENASGNASILRKRFAVSADAGFVQADQGGRVDIAGTSFIVPDITVKGGAPAVVRLRTSSTVTALLSVLDSDPINAMKKAGQSPTIADGRAEMEGALALPLRKGIKPTDIEYSAQGTISSVRSTVLVPDRTLAADALTVVADNYGVQIAGSGRIGSVPFDGKWNQPLGEDAKNGSTLAGTVELSERTLDEFNIGLPKGSVTGAGIANVQMSLVKGQRPTLDLRSTLQGLRLAIPSVGWAKLPKAQGSLRLAATLGQQPDVSLINIEASGLSASGTLSTKPDGSLGRATFSKVKIGGWLDAPVTITGKGPDRVPDIAVNGGVIDMRRADFPESANSADSPPLMLTPNRLQITDTIALTGFSGQFDTRLGMNGDFSGRVNGGAPVTGSLVPQGGRSAIRIKSADAGGVFQSAGVFEQGRGGDLDLTMVPVGEDGIFDGTLRVTGTRVNDVPVLAELLNAVSVVGLLEQLGGQGIHFREVEAKFRLTPSQIILTSSSAIGPSMGLSMDGLYAVASGQLSMQGVISPVYLLNGIGSILT
ncbi:MAG: AsmA family protein, partial [Paracoccaceae bacterium]